MKEKRCSRLSSPGIVEGTEVVVGVEVPVAEPETFPTRPAGWPH